MPIVAQLAPDEQRGRAVGTVTTGLLSSILLSCTLGGYMELRHLRCVLAVAEELHFARAA